MNFESPSSVLVLAPAVLKALRKFRQNCIGKTEACGVLIGEGDIDQGQYSILKVTTPMVRDIRRREFFKIIDGGHQKLVDEEWKKSSGERFYLGFWHTHPEPYPQPSAIDLESWNENFNLNVNHAPSLFYPIVGLNEIAIWDVSKLGVIKMSCINE